MEDRIAIGAVVFDLGGVLIDWNPRHLYRKLFDEEEAMERFLREVCSPDWIRRLDAGRSFEEGLAELMLLHPEQEPFIRAWRERWEEMLGGEISGTVALLEELHSSGMPLYALTNWSAETFPIGRRRFAFLNRFRHILISGEEGVIKPDPRIFGLLIERTGLIPERTIFVDDSQANVAAALGLGFQAIRFIGAEELRGHFQRLGLLSGSTPHPH
ncbi:MAG TPA: HAD family phosphatase [Alphaproteobacteria bacterium]|nr:HAD family phosphatase [Alphaproteobacteria bacterium]